MSRFTEEYKARLIKQYFYKEKAGAEIELQAGTWEKAYNLLLEFPDQFDVDSAFGNQLDIIGRIVGVNRIVPFVIDKIRFGFDGDSSARGMADAFDSSVESAIFFEALEQPYANQELDDEDFRLFIKAKISSNASSAYMVSDERLGINKVLQSFLSGAYAIDNLDMTLLLFVPDNIDDERIRLIEGLNLLPKPQGVRYRLVRYFVESDSFGFDGDAFALGFGDAFDTSIGGTFAEFIFL